MVTTSPQLPSDFQPLLFNSLGSRQVVTDFSAGHLSSDGGMLLLRQIDEGVALPLTVGMEIGLYSGFPMVRSNFPCP